MNFDRALAMAASLAVLAMSGCGTVGAVVASCGQTDLSGKEILYFGPSNRIGPGSVWIRLQGGYQPRWRFDDLAISKSVVEPGAGFQCGASADSKLVADGGASVLSKISRVSLEAKSDFSRAKSITVSSDSAAWDTIVTGPFESEVKRLKSSTAKRELQGEPGALVMIRALRVDGYTATLDFDESLQPSIKAKYEGKALGRASIGDAGATLDATWTRDNKLQLKAKESVYVAGMFAVMRDGEFAPQRGPASTFVLEDLGDGVPTPFDPEKPR